MDSTTNPIKVKTMKGEGIGACSLAHITSKVEGHAEALRVGLGQVKSGSIIHTNLHKPSNKLVSA
jgi:hypothetical protein